MMLVMIVIGALLAVSVGYRGPKRLETARHLVAIGGTLLIGSYVWQNVTGPPLGGFFAALCIGLMAMLLLDVARRRAVVVGA